MNASNLSLSNSARARSLNNATQTVQQSASVTAVDLGPSARPGEPLQVLYITSKEDFPDEVDEMEDSFGLHQLNAGLLELSQIEGDNPDEKKSNLAAKVAQLHKGGRINNATITIISMHGKDGPEFADRESSLTVNQIDSDDTSHSSVLTSKPYLLSVMKGQLEVDFTWLISCVRNMNGDGSSYKGQIHLTACQAKRCMDLVKGDGLPYIAYGGRKIVSSWDAKVTCLAVINLLGHYHQNRMEFPAPEKIAEHAALISGSTVSAITPEKSVSFSALKSKPQFMILNKAVAEWLETKASRVLEEKLMHGSFASVQKVEEKFGEKIWSHLRPSVIFDAVESKRDVVSKLVYLEKNKVPLDVLNKDGDGLLHVAMESEDLEVIEFCIANKLDPNAENADGDRPLHYALTWGLIDVVKSLIKGGANPSLWVIDNNEKYNFLHYAVAHADKDCVAAILESPLVEINALSTEKKHSALHWAAWRDNSEMIAILVAKGADLNIRDKDGDTPLQLALSLGKMDAAKALQEAGAI